MSINDHPVELEHTIKLTPYYDLINNEKKRAYFKKAMNSLLENYGTGNSVRRNAEALKEETAARVLASAWFSSNKWKFVTVVAAGSLAAAAVAAGPATSLAVGTMVARTYLWK